MGEGVVRAAGPVTIIAGLILLAFDFLTMFFYYNMETNVNWSYHLWDYVGLVIPVANVINSVFTIVYGILLTVFARMSNAAKALLAYAIIDSLLLAYHLGVIIYYMVIIIDIWTTYAVQIVWCK